MASAPTYLQWRDDLGVDDYRFATANIVYDQWVALKFEIDLDSNTVSEYYNGNLLSTHTWDDTGHVTLQAIDLFGNIASPIYYDNLSITEAGPAPVPEPATILLVGLGLMGLAGVRRKFKN